MAYDCFAGNTWRGLSTDTKPSATTYGGFSLAEIDTGKWFLAVGGAWVREDAVAIDTTVAGHPLSHTHASHLSIGATDHHNNANDHANSLDHSNANDPSADQKAALAGSSGVPSTTNKYVTDADARNTNARTPSSTLTHGDAAHSALTYEASGAAATHAAISAASTHGSLGHSNANDHAQVHASAHIGGTDPTTTISFIRTQLIMKDEPLVISSGTVVVVGSDNTSSIWCDSLETYPAYTVIEDEPLSIISGNVYIPGPNCLVWCRSSSWYDRNTAGFTGMVELNVDNLYIVGNDEVLDVPADSPVERHIDRALMDTGALFIK